MKSLKPLLLVFILLSFSPFLPAQQEEGFTAEDTTYEYKDYDDFGIPFYFNLRENPVIEFSYGISKIKNRDVNASFSDAGLAEMRLGFQKRYLLNSKIIKQRNSFIYIDGISNNLVNKTSGVMGLSPEMWRLGLGQAYGFGYYTGNVSLSFYSSNSLGWTSYSNAKTNEELVKNESSFTGHYNNSIRFGSSTEGGIVLKAGNYITLRCGYDRSLVFPGYVFWEHSGSMLLEYGALALIDRFIMDIQKSSIYAVPVVDFLLKNAFSYALYTLRSEKMNWPFNGAAPLEINTFKIGLTFLF
jgi:hypothetical protein